MHQLSQNPWVVNDTLKSPSLWRMPIILESNCAHHYTWCLLSWKLLKKEENKWKLWCRDKELLKYRIPKSWPRSSAPCRALWESPRVWGLPWDSDGLARQARCYSSPDGAARTEKLARSWGAIFYGMRVIPHGFQHQHRPLARWVDSSAPPCPCPFPGGGGITPLIWLLWVHEPLWLIVRAGWPLLAMSAFITWNGTEDRRECPLRKTQRRECPRPVFWGMGSPLLGEPGGQVSWVSKITVRGQKPFWGVNESFGHLEKCTYVHPQFSINLGTSRYSKSLVAARWKPIAISGLNNSATHSSII